MSELADLQRQFLMAITSDGTSFDNTQLSAAIVDQTHGIEKVLNVYRNNWRSNLRNALRVTYPVVERLVGAEYFDWMADKFIDAQPSQSGNLDNYGAEFPEFVRNFPGVEALPYLADVALFEFCVDAVMVAPEELPSQLLPSRLMTSPFPIHRIWQVNQEGWEGDDTVSLDEGAAYLLIQRRTALFDAAVQYDLHIQPLTADEFSELSSLLSLHVNAHQG